MRRYVCIIEWADGDVEDADEIRVWARSADEAVAAARGKWTATVGATWPHCRIDRIAVERTLLARRLQT